MIIESIEKRKNSPGRLIACYECGEALIMMGRKTADYKIAVYCRCGGVEYREKGIRLEENGGIALKEGDAYICPQCGEILFEIKEEAVRNTGFKVRCACGMVFGRAKPSEKPKRALGTFASIE